MARYADRQLVRAGSRTGASVCSVARRTVSRIDTRIVQTPEPMKPGGHGLADLDPPEPTSYPTGRVIVRQGDPGDSLFLVLDGVLTVDVDGDQVAELGPGAPIGERAVLDGGHRTATATAVTPVRVAEVPAAVVDRSALEYLAGWRQAENR